MTTVTINGNTYSADGSSAKDMLNGGHRTHFIPMVGDVATVAGVVATQAAQTAIDAVNAANGAAATRGTSTTSLTVAAGTQSITTQSGKQFVVGNYVTVSRTSAPATLMHGIVTSYATTALVVDVSTTAGSGTYTDWTIALSGAKGNTGATGSGDIAYLAKTSTYTVTAADKGKLIDCTSGTFTLAFQATATLGANWATYIRNSGTGVITLDPNAAETIDGAATYTLNPGSVALVQCDGTVLRIGFCNPTQTVRLPIFSAEAVSSNAASVLETMENSVPLTGLGAQVGRVVYGNSLFIASASAANSNVATSPDGLTWTLRAMPSSASWVVSTDGASKHVAVSKGTTATASSTNGTTWATATALATASHASFGAPVFVGSTCLVVATVATTLYTSGDNGVTWNAQTLPAAATARPYVVGGLFLIMTSTTQYYTSATGATGSWTLRSFPLTAASLAADSDGAVFTVLEDTNYFRTTDGIAWTDLGFGSADGAYGTPSLINGVYSVFYSSLGRAATRHNSKWVLRSSSAYPLSDGFVKNTAGTIFVGPCSLTTGVVLRVAPTESTAATALFTK